MPELLHPGVYVLEVPSAVRPIEGVSTSTAAFVGVADKGPVPGTPKPPTKPPTGRMAQPLLVTSFTEYLRNFGSFRQDSFLTYAVQAFFNNGGRRVYIVRVAGTGAASSTVDSLQFTAAAPGAWSSLLGITVGGASDNNPDHFDLTVTARGQTGPIQVEKFPNLTGGVGLTVPSKFIQITSAPATRPANRSVALVGGLDAAGAAPATPATVTTAGAHGIMVSARYPGTWANGNLTVAVADATNGQGADFDLVVKLNGTVVERFTNVTFGATPPPSNYARKVINAGSQYITLPNDFTVRPDNSPADEPLAGGTDGTGGVAVTWGLPFAISATSEGVWGNAISVAIGDSSDRDPKNFKLQVLYNGTPVEAFDRVSFQGSSTLQAGAPNPAEYGRTAVNTRSEYIAITSDFTSRPATTAPVTLLSGSDGDTSSVDFIGEPALDNTVTGTGLHALDKITDVNLIAIPGQGDTAFVNAGMEYCKTRQLQDCFFIGDVGTLDPAAARFDGAKPDIFTLSDLQGYATGTQASGTPPAQLDKSAGDYGAIYFPWVAATDPIGRGRNPLILLPPAGFLAGLYARIDNSRGVFKAPAGTEAGIFGALAPNSIVGDADQDELNPINVNVIRTVPGAGLVVWGARTIGSDPAWRYIPVRRMAIFLRVSIYYGIQWAVFEPNDEPLWASLRLNIRAFMLTQFRAGAFQGSKPDDAFFVKCDSTTTTQTDIDNGVVNILVGFAPLKPAEFVVLQLSQKVNQPAQ